MTTPVCLLVPILCGLALAGPAVGQVPSTTRVAPPTKSADSEWRVLSTETVEGIAASIASLQERIARDGDDAAWDRMTCHTTKLTELRGLRRAAVDATEKVARGLESGHLALVRQEWGRLLVTHDHAPLLYQEALTCSNTTRRDIEQVSVVRVSAPAWDGDEELGEAPPRRGR